MSRSGRSRWALLIACVLPGLACAPRAPLPFDGPGRMAVILADEDRSATLFVLSAEGSAALPTANPSDVRFAGGSREALFVLSEVPVELGLPEKRPLWVDVATGAASPLAEAGGWYDPEVSPDGRLVVVGRDVATLGDSDLEVRTADLSFERVAARRQGLEEPRWRPDGRAFVVARMMADPESEGAGGSSIGGLTWPRLHLVGAELGRPRLLHDGAGTDALAPGGTLPLWWDARGIFARQRGGLVRCDPRSGGCAPLYDPGRGHRVVDGRPGPGDTAFLLVVVARGDPDRRFPNAIHRVDLGAGVMLDTVVLEEGRIILDLDWAP